MTLSITFYDDIKYHRMDFINRDLDFIGNGVVNLTDFPITYPSPSSMNLSLGQGIAWVDGYRIPNDSNLVTVTVPSADTTYPRIDIIQIGHDDINQTYSLVVKKGVPAASPIEPGADPNYVKLYAINVAANATSITSANVIDRRALVPLKVSGTQITFNGAASNNSNNFTGTQTAPEFVATSQTAPIQLPNLTLLPNTVPAAGVVCVVNNQWYVSDGTKWIIMTSRVASANEVLITGTSAQTIATYTPNFNGNYEVRVSVGVITAPTNVTITLTYTNARGAQTYSFVSNQSLSVGDHGFASYPFTATSGQPITVQVTASTANQVYASCSIVG